MMAKKTPAAGAGASLANTGVIERRASVRFSCERRGIWFQVGGGRLGPSWCAARLRDLSAGGIGLILERRFEPGMVLAAELTNAAKSFSRQAQLRVVHATAQADGSYVVGCAFGRLLTDQELQALL